MSLIRVAVPVLHGRSRFYFEKGRPWSVIEHVLLEALTKKYYTMSELANAGCLPRRLAIEAVIRLMRAGWVEMIERKSSVKFRATHSGVIAATYGELPNAPRQLNRSINFIVDQITGTVYRRRELPFLPQYMVEEIEKTEKIVWIQRPQIEKLDEVGPLLDVLFSDDERFISMDYDGGRLADRWALVSVRDGIAQGLTSRAPAELVDCIQTAASSASVEDGSGKSRQPYQLPNELTTPALPVLPARRINLLATDLVLGGREHEDTLHRALSRSRHRVIIHSTFVSWDRFSALLPAIRDAIERGVRLDVLWGQEESLGNTNTQDAVRRIRSLVKREQLDSLNVHPFSTGSHSKILLADEGNPDRFFAFVGSCNWLSSPFVNFEASVRLRDPSVVADVLDQVAELSKGARGHWSTLTKQLAAMSATLRTRSNQVERGRTYAQVVLGSTHADLVRRARDESQERIIVVSHRWGTAATPMVWAPARAAAKHAQVRVNAYYGTVSGPVDDRTPQDHAMQLSYLPISIVQIPRLHAKLLAWDADSVVITSQNWLSSDPPDSAPRQEIGIFLNGPGIAERVLHRFYQEIQSSPANTASPITDSQSDMNGEYRSLLAVSPPTGAA